MTLQKAKSTRKPKQNAPTRTDARNPKLKDVVPSKKKQKSFTITVATNSVHGVKSSNISWRVRIG